MKLERKTQPENPPSVTGKIKKIVIFVININKEKKNQSHGI